jgi:FKBP-type peptidyl-prolyl cis-trans isomerase (trigger factor)
MNRKSVILLLGTIIGLTLTGCQSSQTTEKATEKTTEKTTEAPESESVLDLDAIDAIDSIEDIDEEESDEPLDPITPSDYLVSDAASYVTLGSYDGIPVEVITYEITDDMVQERVEEELEMYASEVEKDGAAAEGDIIYADITYTEEGSDETTSEEDFFTTIGYEEFGTEFDQHLIGASAGDSLSFSIDYSEDDMMIDWEGKTVNFTVEITSVCSLDIPAYDDAFLNEFTDYTSKEDYEASLRETLESEYEETSYSDAVDSLVAAALDRTEFSGYPQDLYDSSKEETLDFYRMFVGDATEEEICEMLDITSDELDADVLSTVNLKLLVSAYCQANDLTVSEEDYVSYVEESADYYGEPSAVSFEESYGRDSLVWALYESLFCEALYNSADITETAYDPDAYTSDEFEPDELDVDFVEDAIELETEEVTE